MIINLLETCQIIYQRKSQHFSSDHVKVNMYGRVYIYMVTFKINKHFAVEYITSNYELGKSKQRSEFSYPN